MTRILKMLLSEFGPPSPTTFATLPTSLQNYISSDVLITAPPFDDVDEGEDF